MAFAVKVRYTENKPSSGSVIVCPAGAMTQEEADKCATAWQARIAEEKEATA